jgi:epsilon-lactone hydrolase
MSDTEIGVLRAKLASRVRSDDYRQRRKDMDAGFLQYGIARDVTVEPVTANGVRAEWTSTPRDDRDAALLYVHGGGYVIGSLDSHRHVVSEAGRAAKAWALALDYRLAPEHPFPAAVEDAVSGYRYLLSRGIRPERIAIAGDSAGGGLVVAAMLAIRDAGLAQPATVGASRLGSTWRGLASRCRARPRPTRWYRRLASSKWPSSISAAPTRAHDWRRQSMPTSRVLHRC